MQKLSLIIGTLVLLTSLHFMERAPHGKDFKLNCDDCHGTENWKVNPDSIRFDHDSTAMPLLGQHREITCRDCHASLIFDEAKTDCITCHVDLHEQTTGPDCARCHNSESWIINNIRQVHEQTRFPLVGAHVAAPCEECHPSSSLLRFEPMGIECFDCHKEEYFATTRPNHPESGYSTNCSECHFINSYSWQEFSSHDAMFFPIYSGQHNGEWNDCSDCHTNAANYGEFSCVTCHEHNRGDMDEEHNGVSGYSYNSFACYSCHPRGDKEGSFNHNSTNFPLTGAHTATDCRQCHTNGFAGTSSICSDCHQPDFNQATNPDHVSNTFPNACADCHTTQAGWQPATFPLHNSFYQLNGAHAIISNNCATCHNGNYNTTPNTCIGCHQQDYNQTNNPPHASAQFSTECLTCHTETAWTPSTFNHDAQYFPIYSGKHNGEWNTCADCHTNASNFAQFSCIDCHEHNKPEMDDKHQGVNGYNYSSSSCFACHPTGNADDGFNHSSTGFPLTGAHIGSSCIDCHTNGYAGTSTLCSDCHQSDFNQATNPNHVSNSFPNACADCHTTQAGWQPATFALHNSFYPLNGAHAIISNNCATCHNGNYNTTPNTCIGCHQQDYNQTNNPPHASAQFSTECLTCHTETAWTPSTFNHDAQYFPIYSGKHNGEWNTCADCHTNASNYAQFSCIDCHEHNKPDMDDEHQGVNGYVYNSNSCLGCHPDGNSDKVFNRREFRKY